MKTLIGCVCAVAAISALPQGAAAQESFVECPVAALDVAVVSTLPDGWWATPQRGDLVSTEIRVVGGQQTLVCNYEVYGKTRVPVMREPPAGFGSCVAAAGGFNCGPDKQVSGRISGPSAPVRTSPDPVPADRLLRPLKE